MNKKRSKGRWAVGLALALTVGLSGVALAQGVVTLTRQVLGAGGASVSSGNVTLASTLGQPLAGSGTTGNVVISHGFWVSLAGKFAVYLPVTLRNWPPVPAIPTLNPISNPDGVGNYTVSWSSAEFADSYILEEAKYSTFAGALQVYSGVGTSYPVSGRGAARYYYHVKAHNSYGDSAWSAARSVDVLWEAEPNNDGLEANGPLVSGLTYLGTFPDSGDTKDYFYIELSAAHTIEVWLTNIPAGQNYDLALRDTSLNAIVWSVNGGNADEHILSGVLSPGKYYIQAYHASAGGSPQPYHLVVVYQ